MQVISVHYNLILIQTHLYFLKIICKVIQWLPLVNSHVLCSWVAHMPLQMWLDATSQVSNKFLRMVSMNPYFLHLQIINSTCAITLKPEGSLHHRWDPWPTAAASLCGVSVPGAPHPFFPKLQFLNYSLKLQGLSLWSHSIIAHYFPCTYSCNFDIDRVKYFIG